VGLLERLQVERDRTQVANDALTIEQQKLQSAIDCMADVVIFADPSGRVQYRNHAARDLWGTNLSSGDNLRVCHSRETWEKLLAKLADPDPHGGHPVLSIGGRSYEATTGRVCTDEGELKGVVMVGRDITDRLAETEQRMHQERLSVVGKMAAGLAHEINNPLGAIALYAQHVQGRLDAESPLRDHLGTVLRNANQCSKIVRDLLTYAKQRVPELRPSDVAPLLRHVVNTIHYQARDAGVEVRCENSTAPDVAFFGDADQLGQVLVNLAINGIEAMANGGQLSLRASDEEPDVVRFEVTDSGPGIPEEETDRIFSAFYTTKAQGTGLGLAVATDIVRAHRGTIELESKPGRGATFVVRVPTHPERQEASP
jgi:signal transduction histidine kinase